MLRRLNDKHEKILKTLSTLVEESAKGTPIIVEGKKDAETLQEFGITGPIITVKTGGRSFFQILHEVEQAHPPEVILLLDFDRRGRDATARFTQGLEHARIKPNLTFWHALQALVGREVQSVESLTSYVRTLSQKTNKM